jgi:Spy/CpxP family protein refolding chaperone
MNPERNLRSSRILLSLLLLVTSACLRVRAQSPTPQNPNEPAQTQTQTQASQLPDFAPLNLSPDQIQKIRAINAELKDQRQAANQKLRQAQRALAEAVESPTPNETLIEQRSREVADAQSSVIRVRSLTEARVLQVMTPEQRIKLKEIRQRNQAARREANQQRQGNVLGRKQQGLQTGPGPNQRKVLRQKQKP